VRRGDRNARSALLILATLCVLAVVSVLAAGEVLTRAAHRAVGEPPPDLQATTVTIPVGDGGTLSGWFARGAPGHGAVLLLHGVRSDRRQMVGRARFLRKAGYAVLLVDLPAHGRSTGERITFGHREARGVRAALRFLRDSVPDARIGVIGVSLGAASLVLAEPRPAPDALVLESMYATVDDAVEDRLAMRLGPAGRLMAPLLLWQLGPRLGVTASQLRPVDRMVRLDAPVLMISGARDLHTPLRDTERLFAAAGAPKTLWVVPGAAHVDLHRHDPIAYERRVLAFFDAPLRRL
jgi:uncharacterized protein